MAKNSCAALGLIGLVTCDECLRGTVEGERLAGQHGMGFRVLHWAWHLGDSQGVFMK